MTLPGIDNRMKTISTNLFVYGIAHFLVDAVCIGVLFSLLHQQIFSDTVITYLFIIYNLLAFGLQVIIGFFVDNLKAPRSSALLGLILTGIAAVLFASLPVLAVVIAGIGNALFHVGGGIVSDAGSVCLVKIDEKMRVVNGCAGFVNEREVLRRRRNGSCLME